jgi:hypothetical protein
VNVSEKRKPLASAGIKSSDRLPRGLVTYRPLYPRSILKVLFKIKIFKETGLRTVGIDYVCGCFLGKGIQTAINSLDMS